MDNGRSGQMVRRMLVVYTLSNCDRCRMATKWLRARHIAFVERPIRETPPSPPELRAMLAAVDGDLRKIFNVSGREYREQKLGERIDDLAPAAAIDLLAANGSLVKRPFAIGNGIGLAGFDEKGWEAAFRHLPRGTV